MRVNRASDLIIKVGALAIVVAAGVWAYHANVASGRTAMDMTARVESGRDSLPVMVARVERGLVRGTVVYTGNVAAFNEEDIYPRVTGRILEIPVYPGDTVRPGQVVARLDDVELSSRVREAEAMLATAQRNLAQMEAEVVAAHHGISQMEKELAMTEAEASYWSGVVARTERLFNSGAVSRQEYENDRSMATSNEAKREAARAKVEQARAMETSAKRKLEAGVSMVAQAQAQLRTAQVVRDYVNITATSAGFVAKRLLAPGVLVQPGMAILKITQTDKVRLQANVGEKDLSSIRIGSPIIVTTTSNGRPPVTARVTSLFPFVDQGARTAVIEAVVENDGRRLLPGQYVTMRFVTGERPDALSIPRQAVARMGGKATVWVLKDDRVEHRDVTTGLENPERVEITSGLQANEAVVVGGHDSLYAGARVTPVNGVSAPGEVKKIKGMEKVNEPATTPPTSKEGGHGGH